MKIGVFDSGLGGLTVLSKLISLMPNEDFVYFGDNARVPYGNKSQKAVEHFSEQAVKFLLSKEVEMIVIACNTASALALDHIKKIANVPVIGMIDPAVEFAAANSENKKVLVIGTESTIGSGVYQRKLIEKGLQVSTKACPLFVPFVEAGLTEHPALDLIAMDYLKDFREEDTVILGCTHYPFLKKAIDKFFVETLIIDTGKAAAEQVKNELNSSKKSHGKCEYYVSDKPNNFIKIAEKHLELKIKNLQQIDIEEW